MSYFVLCMSSKKVSIYIYKYIYYIYIYFLLYFPYKMSSIKLKFSGYKGKILLYKVAMCLV